MAEKKAATPKPENQIKALQGRVRSLEARVDNLIARLSAGLNITIEEPEE